MSANEVTHNMACDDTQCVDIRISSKLPWLEVTVPPGEHICLGGQLNGSCGALRATSGSPVVSKHGEISIIFAQSQVHGGSGAPVAEGCE